MQATEPIEAGKARILYIEDSAPLGELFRLIMESKGYQVDLAITGEQGLSMHHQSPYDILALDFELPDMLGIDIAKIVLAENRELPILLITGKGSEEIAADAMSIGVRHYIRKGDQRVYTKLVPLIINQLNDFRLQRLEQEALNKQIRANEQRMSAFFSNPAESIFITGVDGQFQFANRKFLDEFNMTPEEIQGKTFSDLYPEKIAKPIEEHARKVIENHVIDQFEVKIPGKNGDERIILTRQFPIENSERTITALGGVMHDVTEIQLAETRMRDSFLRLSTILESTQEGFITIDNKGIIETVNPAGCQIFGYDASELLGQDVSILMQKDEQSAHKGYIKNSKTLEPKIIHKTRNLTGKKKDGNLFPLELNISPMTLSGEKKIVGCFKDISERKAWENELLHSDERLKRSQAFAKIGTWDWTIETGELFWSEQIAILFGYDKGELETTFDNFVAALHPDDREAVLGAVNACVHDNADYDIEHRVIWPDGSVRWLHEKGDVIRKGDGSPDRMLGVVSDITQQKNLEQALHSARENLEQQVDERTHELKDAKDAAQRADYAKSEFLANMSHELRTPLNGILGFSEMMKIETFGPIQNETYKTYINDIHYSGGYLLNIINEILDLSRIESGEAEMEMVNVHINDIFDFSVNAVTQQATKASVEISIDIEDGLPPLLADKTRLQQIIINLLSNGVNYNHETGGLVTLRAKSQSNGGLAIIVEDNGIGIDEENIDRVMGRFEKAHSSHARTSTGIGLGLPIVRLLCERHKANFSLESEEGKGTVAMVAFAKDQLVAPQVQ